MQNYLLGFFLAKWRCFCATVSKGLCESKRNQNPMWLMRNDRSWTAANEFSAEVICWNFTSVQKANTGFILYLNLMLQLLKMLALAPFLSVGLRIWHLGNWLSAIPLNYNNKCVLNYLIEKCRKTNYFLRTNTISQISCGCFLLGGKKKKKDYLRVLWSKRLSSETTQPLPPASRWLKGRLEAHTTCLSAQYLTEGNGYGKLSSAAFNCLSSSLTSTPSLDKQ